MARFRERSFVSHVDFITGRKLELYLVTESPRWLVHLIWLKPEVFYIAGLTEARAFRA